MFKNYEMTSRIRLVLDKGLCWRCLGPKHQAFHCTRKDIDACSRWLHNKLVCNCNYSGKKTVLGSLAISKSFALNKCMDKAGVRLPVLPIRVYSQKGSKLVYALQIAGAKKH